MDPSPSAVGPWASGSLVFATSGAVLVIEIVAGRLMAPYVGVSLETFTGIIGTVLAGIALGAVVGGSLADRHDPRRLVGPALVLSGLLTWLSLPIVLTLGPHVSPNPLGIVTLTTVTFLAPTAVLSAVAPMIAKIRLDSIARTGSVVGGLSAAGTLGALAGTFVTGFVLIATLPSRLIVLGVGALLVAAGCAITWRWLRRGPTPAGLAATIAAAALALSLSPPCDHETRYYCVQIVDDPARATGRSLYLDDLRHAYVDLADPTYLDLRYVRVFAAVADVLPPGPIDAVHLGGGGFTFPRYVDATRPDSTNVVIEIDAELVDIARTELGLRADEGLRVVVSDARVAVRDLPSNSADLVVGDAFGSTSVPWHLTTLEFVAEIERVLRPGGIYVLNVIDGGASRFARAELATLAERFGHTAAVVPASGVPSGPARVNQVLVASGRPFTPLRLAPGDGRVLEGQELERYVDGARALTDDFAPVDQMLRR